VTPPRFIRIAVNVVRMVATLAFIEAAVRRGSLVDLGRRLGVTLDFDAEPVSGGGRPALELDELRRVALARALAQRWPFRGCGVCLRTSLLIGHELRSHDPRMRLGVTLVDGAVAAHAWLEVAGGELLASDDYLTLHTQSPGSPADRSPG
jgi:hypothetical protein